MAFGNATDLARTFRNIPLKKKLQENEEKPKTSNLVTNYMHMHRVYRRYNLVFIPAERNQAVEDDTKLEWHVPVIYPPQNRPELHIHPIKVLKDYDMIFVFLE